jgi:hypothetical protein
LWDVGAQAIAIEGMVELMTARFAYGADIIEIIDSVPEDHSQTARHLEQHIEDFKYEPSVVQIPRHRRRVVTAPELYTELSEMASTALEKNLWPLLHIEAHGGKEGLQLAGGDLVKWADLQPYLMALNKATRNHLFIMMAACEGFHGIKAMFDRADHAACLRLLGGPTEEASAGRLSDAMKGFYNSLLRTGDLDEATSTAQQSEETFRLYSAEAAFMKAWTKALEQYPTGGKALQEKAEQIITMMNTADLPLPERPHAKTKQAIRQLDLNIPFQAYRRKFFMLDLFPELEAEISTVKL